ncbi:MAG: HDOD domain-containing protein [Herminiimonas sp.]|nr:HDOD domain-containing protein [Herminiimonas sp.]
MTTSSLPSTMHRIDADDIVRKLQTLPTLSAVVADLLNCVDQDDIDIITLARKVSHDQALTAKTLRFANSSFFGTQSKVSTIQQAISLIGVQSMRHLIMTTALSGHFVDGNCPGFDPRAFWRHSLATAVCCKVLAMHLHLNQDFAFTAGLLHDIGRLVLVTCFPQQYAATLAYRAATDCLLLDAERTVLGTDHVMFGQALAAHWNFSEIILKAIAGHHAPETFGSASIASIVHVANSIVHALDLAGDEDDLVSPVSQVAWDGLGMQEDEYAHIFRETEMQFEAISQALLA